MEIRNQKPEIGKRTSLVVCALLLAASTGLAAHSVNLTWTASTDAAANPSLTYNIYRLAGACPNAAPATASALLTAGFVLANSAPITTANFSDAEVTVGKYCYAATSVLSGAESVPSNLAPAVILPSPPSALSVSASN